MIELVNLCGYASCAQSAAYACLVIFRTSAVRARSYHSNLQSLRALRRARLVRAIHTRGVVTAEY